MIVPQVLAGIFDGGAAEDACATNTTTNHQETPLVKHPPPHKLGKHGPIFITCHNWMEKVFCGKM